jgi:hypothetical protein
MAAIETEITVSLADVEPVIEALSAAEDVVLQRGRHRDPALVVVPRVALDRLEAAMRPFMDRKEN